MKISASLRRFLWHAICCFLFSQTWGQQESFKRFNIEDGLPQNYIYSISQTAKGALLVATGEGLVRYNGREFTVVKNTDSSLNNSFVTASYLFDSTQMFLGHYNGEISNYKNGKLELIAPAGENGSIRKIFADQWGRLWILNQQHQIRCMLKNKKWISHEFDAQGAVANDALLISQSSLLLATGGGAFIADISQDKKLKISEIEQFAFKNMVGITQINDATYWLASEDEGVYKMQYDSAVNKISKIEKVQLADSITRGIRNMTMDSWGNIWIGRKNSGLSKLVFQKNKMDVHTYSGIGEQEIKFVNCLFQDKEGTIWVGTYGNGLYQKKDKVLQHYRLDAFGSANDVRSLLDFGKETLLLGTTEGLVKVRMLKSGIRDVDFYTELHGKTITSLAMNGNCQIWVGTESNGVYVMSENGHIRRDKRLTELDNKSVNHIRIDAKGKIWISTNTEGVIVLEKDSKINYNTTSGLPHNQVIMTHADREDRTWYATFGGSMATSKNGEFVLHDAKSGLNAYNINSIDSDSKGNIWMATYGKGLYSFNIVQFNPFTQNEDLLSQYNYSIICDDFDNLWLGSRAGISRINPEDKQVFNYKIPEAEVNANATLKTENGDLWFGTNNGIYRHVFKSYIHNTIPPLTSLVGFVIGRDTLSKFDSDINWDYTDAPVSFVLEGLSLKSPENVRYRYKLEGYNAQWSVPQVSNVITIGNLRENEYALYVQSTNNDGVWGPEQMYSFVVIPPFWRSGWFYITASLVVIIFFVVFVKWRERALIESNRRLEKIVQQRTATVNAQKDELEEKNRDIQDSIDYASRIQQAILSDVDLKHNHVQEIFVLYIPKDVVSGDFYWINESSQSLIVAAADCTGHGVPGAFMSFIGANGLRRTVIDKGRERPDEILNSLNQFVMSTLQQKHSDDIIKDGMDITICRIDQKGFQFAGAQNPLYWLHKGELLEIKGDKQPIGHVDVESRPFNVHDLEKNEGDMIYLFSDGYADQFGGPKDKKFMYKRFKDLLVEICDLKAEVQEQKLKEAFLSWRGATEQVDDVLVIGMRL